MAVIGRSFSLVVSKFLTSKRIVPIKIKTLTDKIGIRCMKALSFQIFRFVFFGFLGCLNLTRRLLCPLCRFGILALNGKTLDEPSLDLVPFGVDLGHCGHKALDVARQVLVVRIRGFLQLIRGIQPSPPDGPLLLQYHFIPNPLNGRLAIDLGFDLFDHFLLF